MYKKEGFKMNDLIHVFINQHLFFLNHAVEEKIKSLQIDPFNIMQYDLTETPIEDILEDLQTISFFADRKVIVINDFDHMVSLDPTDVKKMIKYIEQPNPDCILILKLREMFNGEHLLHKALMNHAFIEKIKDMDKNTYHNFVSDLFLKQGFQVSKDAVIELLIRTNEDFELLQREMEKLMLYHYQQKQIDLKDVVLLTPKNLEENIYELTNAVLKKNHSKMIEIYDDLMMKNEDPLRIINQIANKLRELLHTKLLLSQSYTQQDIQNHFNIRSGRAYYLIKDAQMLHTKDIERQLETLAQLDYEIKSGKKDKKLGLELYLLGV